MAKKLRILLVEDDDVGVLLTDVLSGEGYLVDLATTNAEAWACLDAHEYALVIADWKLPDGDGTLVADAAAQLDARTVVMSGYLPQMPGGRADAHETLMKPVRPSELVNVVQRSIGVPLGSAAPALGGRSPIDAGPYAAQSKSDQSPG
jgi:DNA-binding response OmpR family regulator